MSDKKLVLYRLSFYRNYHSQQRNRLIITSVNFLDFFPGLASWYVFFRERDPDFKQSYVTLSEPDSGKQTEGELTLVDKLKVWQDSLMTRNVLCLDIWALFFLRLPPFF